MLTQVADLLLQLLTPVVDMLSGILALLLGGPVTFPILDMIFGGLI